MASTRYERGRDAEYRVQRELEAEGYQTARMAGSHSACDVIAWNGNGIRFIQVKTFISRKGNYAADIEKLRAIDRPPNSNAELWVRKIGQVGWLEKITV